MLINAYSGSTLVASDTGGAQAGKACLVADTSTILMHGTRPEGDIQLSTCLSVPANPSELTPFTGDGSSPSVTPTKLLTPITAHASSTYYGGSWYSASDVNIRQGVMSMKGGDKVLSGCMWFDISSASGKTIRSATLTLTRLAGYGVSGDVDVILWGTKVTGRSGRATSGAVSYGSIGAIGNGETKVFSVPVEAITALINGTMGGLMLQSTDTVTKAGKGYSRNYAMFAGAGTENAPKLTITFQ